MLNQFYLLDNPGLEKFTNEELVKQLLCQFHFGDAFCNPVTKNRLKSRAVPIYYEECNVNKRIPSNTENEINVLISEITYGRRHQEVTTNSQTSILVEEE